MIRTRIKRTELILPLNRERGTFVSVVMVAFA
jgi:hypothetical protein